MAETRSQRLRRLLWLELRAVGGPIAAFWFANLVGWLACYAALMPTVPDLMALFIIMGALGSVNVICAGFGQLCAVLRLRTLWALGLASIIWSIAVWAMVAGFFVSPVIGALTMLFVGLGPYYVATGYWSLRENTAFLATLSPIIYLTTAIIIIASAESKMAIWKEGSKWAFFSPISAAALFVGIVVILIYLWTRERAALLRWQHHELALQDAQTTRRAGNPLAAAAMSCGVLTLVMVGALGLTGATALTAPFLFRTGSPPEDGPIEVEPELEPDTRNKPKPQPPKPKPSSGKPSMGDGPDVKQVERAVKQAGIATSLLLMLLVLTTLAILIFGPPLRRTFVLQHLRRPLYDVPPTIAVRNAWRLAEIALDDAGVPCRPGEAAADHLARARAVLPPELDPDQLLACATIADRVRFGFGLTPDDRDLACRTSEMVYEAVWEQLGELARLRAIYRWI